MRPSLQTCLGLEGPRVSRRIVAEELKICTGAAFVDLEQQAFRIWKVVFDERLIDPLNIDIDSVVLVIQKNLGVIAAMRFDSLVTKNLCNNRLAENAAELNAIDRSACDADCNRLSPSNPSPK
jgi:hypothetical protein